jgi:hypothetical protein
VKVKDRKPSGDEPGLQAANQTDWIKPMTLANGKALQAIGAYMCAYSDAAHELGETLKALFGIKEKPMADAIVAALGDFARQASLAQALCQDARNADGTELSRERKKQIDKTISDCFACNDDRVKIAHGRLEPRIDGSVAIVYVKVDRGGVKGKDPIIWSPTDWTERTNRLTMLAAELRNFQNELKTIEIQIPTEAMLGWLGSSDYQGGTIHRHGTPAVLIAALSGPNWVPGPPLDEPKK